MTEIVFLLCDAASEAMQHTEHLAPRILAAEIAALVAMPESPLLKFLTLWNALGLRIKVGGRLASCGSRYDGRTVTSIVIAGVGKGGILSDRRP
jgi:hypothetical protein